MRLKLEMVLTVAICSGKSECFPKRTRIAKMPRLSLYWPFDVAGYEIVPEKPHGRSVPIAGGEALRARVVGKSGRTRWGRDIFEIAALYQRLAEVADDAALLDFVNKYGLLRRGKSQPVEEVLEAADQVRSLISLRDQESWIDLTGRFGGLRLQHDVILVPGRPLDFFFQPRTLETAIYMQFAEDVSGGVELRRCRRSGCPNWFKVGLATGGLKATAVYCSPKCQKKDQYVRSKEK